MIDTSKYTQKLEWLKEYIFRMIDNDMRKSLLVSQRTPNGGLDMYFDIRGFDAFCRHKDGLYTNKALREKVSFGKLNNIR